jgi:hypothetical protein
LLVKFFPDVKRCFKNIWPHHFLAQNKVSNFSLFSHLKHTF